MNAFHFLPLDLMRESKLAQWQPYRVEEVSQMLSTMYVTMSQRWMCYCRLALCEKYNGLIGSYHSVTEVQGAGMADALNPEQTSCMATMLH